MRLLRTDQVSLGRNDLVFGQSPVAGWLTALGLLAAAVLLLLASYQGSFPWILGALSAALLLLFSAISAAAARRAHGPSSWLLATDGERALIKFRSYLNTGFPAGVPHVLELRREDVISFRITRVRQVGRTTGGDRSFDRSVFLDITLSPAVDTGALAGRLKEERELRPGASVWRHYPLTLPDGRTLRLEWRGRHARVRPGISQALRALQWIAPVESTRQEQLDLGDFGRAPANTGGDRAIRGLAEQGRIMEAVLMARRTFEISTRQARELVRRIATNSRAEPGE